MVSLPVRRSMRISSTCPHCAQCGLFSSDMFPFAFSPRNRAVVHVILPEEPVSRPQWLFNSEHCEDQDGNCCKREYIEHDANNCKPIPIRDWPSQHDSAAGDGPGSQPGEGPEEGASVSALRCARPKHRGPRLVHPLRSPRKNRVGLSGRAAFARPPLAKMLRSNVR